MKASQVKSSQRSEQIENSSSSNPSVIDFMHTGNVAGIFNLKTECQSNKLSVQASILRSWTISEDLTLDLLLTTWPMLQRPPVPDL